ncbi:polyprenyl synthetase family protein [Candidatus Micrarchaeota archaeon]|nr:polyprenyl synthetase family protein [Candidatus Micrarchaeota archaeon]
MKIDIQKKLAQIRPKIDAAIETYVPRTLDSRRAEFLLGSARYEYDLKAGQTAIHDPIWDLLDRGGKRWRPALMLWAADAVAGPKTAEKLFDFAAIVEVVHNGTLVADDLEDDSLTRRGKPCLHRIYGVDVAVNAGNSMYFLPLLSLAKKKIVPDSVLVKAYEVYIQEMVNLSYGQAFDIAWHHGHADSVTEDQYLQMCAYKTGTLARMAAKLGAILAQADAKTVDAFGEFAESIGIAFQIQDDTLNLVSKPDEYGKDVGEDITEGKRSLLVIHALSKLNSPEKKELLSILNSHTREQKQINRAIALVQRTGAFEYAQAKARHLVDLAWKKLEPHLKASEAKDTLEALAWYAVERKV